MVVLDGSHVFDLASQVKTRDISPSGVGIVHDEPILADVGILKLTAGERELQSGGRILRCEPRDDDRFDVGCLFRLAGHHASAGFACPDHALTYALTG